MSLRLVRRAFVAAIAFVLVGATAALEAGRVEKILSFDES